MSHEVLKASVNETTVAALNTLLLSLNTEAEGLVTSLAGVRMVYSFKMTLTGGTVSSVIFTFGGDHYDDSNAAMDSIIAQVTAAMTAIEGASTYTTITGITGNVGFTVTE